MMYKPARLEIIVFETEDVITTSDGTGLEMTNTGDNTPMITAATITTY